MSSKLQKLLIVTALGAGLSVFGGAMAQQDPLADLLNSPQATPPEDNESVFPDNGPSSSDFPMAGRTVSQEEQDSFQEEIEEGTFPRLAPIFAPDYDPEDYIIRPEGSDDDELTEIEPVDEAEEDLVEEDAGAEPELDFEYMVQSAVTLRGLDKITGRSVDMDVAVGSNAMLGGLRVTVRACHQTPPTEPPESIAYVEVEDYGFVIDDPEELPEDVDMEKRVFNGWMFASSPGLNGLEHAIYDVWVIRCNDEAPVLSDAGSEL